MRKFGQLGLVLQNLASGNRQICNKISTLITRKPSYDEQCVNLNKASVPLQVLFSVNTQTSTCGM